MTEWQTEFHNFMELIFNAPYGSKSFWILAGLAAGVLLIFGWLIANFIFSAKRGLVVSFIAQALPGAGAIAGWIAVTIYAIPELNAGPVRDYLPLAGAILAAFLTTMIFSRFLLGVSEGKALFSVILTYACVAASIFFGGTLVETVDEGIQGLEEKKEQRDSEADSVLQF